MDGGISNKRRQIGRFVQSSPRCTGITDFLDLTTPRIGRFVQWRASGKAVARIAHWRIGGYFWHTRAITMSEIVNVVESLDVRDADKVVLPESAVIGCNGVQIQLMKE